MTTRKYLVTYFYGNAKGKSVPAHRFVAFEVDIRLTQKQLEAFLEELEMEHETDTIVLNNVIELEEVQPEPDLKAWDCSSKDNPAVRELIFAEHRGKAHSLAYQAFFSEGLEWNDIRVIRAPWADGHERDTLDELTRLELENGWIWTINGVVYNKYNLDEYDQMLKDYYDTGET